MGIEAIDLGFLFTKGIIGGKRVIMKSVVGNSKKQNFFDLNMGAKETDHIKSWVGTTPYFVSDLAVEQSDTVIHSLKDDRFDSEATEVLVKTAFALGLGNNHIQSHIVSGLPASHYSMYKDSIQKLFLNKIHNYDVENHGTRIRGSVAIKGGKFIPQPFGALLDRVLDDRGQIADKDLASKTVAVIDPGFGTSDIYVANALDPVEKLTFSTRTAMNHAYGLIATKIEEAYNISLPLYQIEKVISTGQFKKSGKTFNMAPVIDWAYKSTAQQLVSEIINKWKAIHEIDHILIAGGGGIALSPYILKEFENIELLNDAQWAVVSGYYKWGVRNYG